MAQVAALPGGFVGAPGGDVGEGFGEKIARPVDEGRTITDRGDVHNVAVLVYQLIQHKQPTAFVRGRDARNRWPPGSVEHASMGNKLRVSQRRLLRPRGKIVERSQ